MKAVTLIIAAALAAAHVSPATAGPTVGIGEVARLHGIRIRPIAVIEDSRCPINARCIWAGRLILAARIDGRGWHKRLNLTLGKPVSTHGFTIALVSAEPGKLAGSRHPRPARRFGFELR